MDFIKCYDKKSKEELINQGFKLIGTELVNNKKIFIFSKKNINLKMKNKKVFETNKLFF